MRLVKGWRWAAGVERTHHKAAAGGLNKTAAGVVGGPTFLCG